MVHYRTSLFPASFLPLLLYPPSSSLFLPYSSTPSSLQADLAKHRMHIPAPKMKLPGHEESYNPPPEYLPTQEEVRNSTVSPLIKLLQGL